MFARKMWGCLLVLIVCLSPLVSSEEDRCPTNFEPCTCYPVTGKKPFISCMYISDVGVLQDVLNRTDEPFSEFSIGECNVKYIPSRGLIQNTKLVSVVRSTLYNLFDQQPVENHKVTEIVWIDSKLLCGNLWKQLKPLKELRTLSVSGHQGTEIGKAFEQNISPTLEKFSLYESNTKKLYPTIFQKMVNLEFIRIFVGRLSTLKRSMFPEENRLKELNFSYNLIKYLPDDVFFNMPLLEVVELQSNQLKIFSEAVFNPVLDTSAFVDLDGNPISCDCSFKWALYKKTQVKLFGKCDNPSSRKGKDFKDLRPEDFSYCPNSVPTLLETSI